MNTDTNNVEHLSRRNFFKKTAQYSVGAIAAASILSPIKIKADDHAIMEEKVWGTTLGDPVTKNLYGIPSAYEHNNTRRNMKLLSSGNWQAAIAMCPIHEQEGIITPNGLFFSRSHGGTAHIDPNEHRLMIHGLVEKPIVLTMDELKRYPSVTRIHFIECPANGGQSGEDLSLTLSSSLKE